MPYRYPFGPLVSLVRILRKAGFARLSFMKLAGLAIKLLLFEPVRWIESLLERGRQKGKMPIFRPIFILGHWRSGTTHLQTLISSHPSCASMNMYQALFPDQFVLTESWLKPILQTLARWLTYPNPYHGRPLDFDEVQEEDLALNSMGAAESLYWARVLGRPAGLRKVVPTKRIGAHKRLLRKLQNRYPGKRLVLKSPPNLLFLPELMEAYPDAQFVYIYRDSLEVYHSTQKLWQATFDHFALRKLTPDETHAAIVEDYLELAEAYHRHRESLDEARLLEINYHQLKHQEASELEKIWAFLAEEPITKPIESTAYVPQTYQSAESLVYELKEKWGDFFWRNEGEID